MKPKVFHFGPFELNPAQQELRRQGVRLRLPSSRFRLLLLLVTRRGELLSRDQIAASLWTDAQAVDVMSGINTAVNQLRAQLGDDSAEPKYIETVIGSGYRFIAAVTEIELPGPDVVDDPPKVHSESVEDLKPTVMAPLPGSNKQSTKTLVWAVAGLIVGILVLYAVIRHQPQSKAVAGPELDLSLVTQTGDIRVADISSDGNYLAFVRESGGKQTLWVKQLASGRAVQLATVDDSNCPGLSFAPDGSYVYFALKQPLDAVGDLYRVPFLGGNPEKLLTGISGAPAISPDGRRIAFVRSTLVTHGEDSVVTTSIDGSDEKVLITYKAPGIHFNRITWTADGKELVYPVQSVLTVIPAEGGTPQTISDDNWTTIDDLWSLPKDRDLVVVGRRQGTSRPQVFRVSLEGNTIREITHDLSNYTTIRATADGKELLAVQDLILSAIEIYKPTSGWKAQSTYGGNQNQAGISGLAWTPSGKIVYSSVPDRRSEIQLSEADGSNPRVIASGYARVDVPTDAVVSPNGDFVSLVRWSNDDEANIWRMGTDGANEKRLTTGRQDSFPSISPDGKWVVYAAVESDKSVLMKVPSEGGQAIRLTDYSSDYPAVSPDGKWIACTQVSSEGQHVSLAIIPFDGGAPAKIFPLPETADPQPLVWTPDAKAISFISNLNGVSNIWQQSLAGGPPTPVSHFTSGKIFNFRWSHDGRIALSRGSETVDAVLIKNFRDADGRRF